MNDRFLMTLGLARRAAKLCYGFDMTVAALWQAKAVFLSSDCAERTRKNIERAAKEQGLAAIPRPYDKETLGAAIGTKPVCIIGVTDQGFAGSLLKCIEGGK